MTAAPETDMDDCKQWRALEARCPVDALIDSGAASGVVTALRNAALALDRYHARYGVHGSLCADALAGAASGDVTIRPPTQFSCAVPGAYWSPQRRAGEPPRLSDDLYALGLIAKQALQTLTKVAPPSADVEATRLARAAAVFQTLTSWSPSDRPASGAELVRALDAAIGAPHDPPLAPAVHAATTGPISHPSEPAWAAASRVAQARRAHRLAQSTPPRPARPSRPHQVRAPLGKGHYPDMPLPTGWVVALVLILCSVYLLPVYFTLFPSGG